MEVVRDWLDRVYTKSATVLWQSPTLPGSRPWLTLETHSHPQSPTVTHSPPPSPAVPDSPRESPRLSEVSSTPTKICLTLPSLPSSIVTAILRFLRREWTALHRSLPSWVLGSRPVGPYRGPGPLRTPIACTIFNGV